MKNIHVLPTDKPSRLVLDSINNNLFLTTTKSFPTDIMKFQNIYITSDEEIKEGNWILDAEFNLVELAKYNHKDLKRDWLKIILTTDQDLIKDGVQAIDDEFLEWFVKNPSCDSVEVTNWFISYLIEQIKFTIMKSLNKQIDFKTWLVIFIVGLCCIALTLYVANLIK